MLANGWRKAIDARLTTVSMEPTTTIPRLNPRQKFIFSSDIDCASSPDMNSKRVIVNIDAHRSSLPTHSVFEYYPYDVLGVPIKDSIYNRDVAAPNSMLLRKRKYDNLNDLKNCVNVDDGSAARLEKRDAASVCRVYRPTEKDPAANEARSSSASNTSPPASEPTDAERRADLYRRAAQLSSRWYPSDEFNRLVANREDPNPEWDATSPRDVILETFADEAPELRKFFAYIDKESDIASDPLDPAADSADSRLVRVLSFAKSIIFEVDSEKRRHLTFSGEDNDIVALFDAAGDPNDGDRT